MVFCTQGLDEPTKSPLTVGQAYHAMPGPAKMDKWACAPDLELGDWTLQNNCTDEVVSWFFALADVDKAQTASMYAFG